LCTEETPDRHLNTAIAHRPADTALRRGEFEEMMPKPEILPKVAGVELVAMLRRLNQRVETLYDRDHTIGHAFFMNVHCLDELDAVFRRKVIPLLQEYFYEDWKKIAAVLNEPAGGGGFLEPTQNFTMSSPWLQDAFWAQTKLPGQRIHSPLMLFAYLRMSVLTVRERRISPSTMPSSATAESRSPQSGRHTQSHVTAVESRRRKAMSSGTPTARR
jgi:hypothetical protein